MNLDIEGRFAGPAGPSHPPETSSETDLQCLIVRARRGDVDAQGKIIRLYERRVAGFVRPIVRDEETVKDVMQTVAIKLVRRFSSLRDPARFEYWLFSMARNTALDQLRRSRCRPVLVRDESELFERETVATDDRSWEIHEALRIAVRDCDAISRRVLDRLIEGDSYAQISRREGLTIGAIKLRLHRLRLQLRQSVRKALSDQPTIRLRHSIST